MALTKLTKPRARWATFKLKAIGAISRSLYDKLVDNGISVKDFGASTTNTPEENQVAIQAALDFGGHIVLPEMYRIKGKVIADVNNTVISGSGGILPEQGVLPPYGMLSIKGDGIRLKDITLDGDADNVIKRGSFGSDSVLGFINGVKNVKVDDVKINNTAYSAVTFDGDTDNIEFNRLEMNNIGEHPFYISGGNNKRVVINGLDLFDFGVYQTRQPSDPDHDCYVVKTRGDLLGDNHTVEINDLNLITSDACTQAYAVSMPSYIKVLRISRAVQRDESTKVIKLVNSTRAASFELEAHYCKGFDAAIYGSAPLPSGSSINLFGCDFGYHHNSRFNSEEKLLLNIEKAVDCKWNLSSNSSIMLSESNVEIKSEFLDCTFEMNKQVNFVINNPIMEGKIIKFSRVTFKSNTDSANDAIFMLVQVPTFLPSFVMFYECSGHGNLNDTFRYSSDVNNTRVIVVSCTTNIHTNMKTDGLTYRPTERTNGSSANRPSYGRVGVGYSYFDTTLNKPIYATDSGWVDAIGDSV